MTKKATKHTPSKVRRKQQGAPAVTQGLEFWRKKFIAMDIFVTYGGLGHLCEDKRGLQRLMDKEECVFVYGKGDNEMRRQFSQLVRRWKTMTASRFRAALKNLGVHRLLTLPAGENFESDDNPSNISCSSSSRQHVKTSNTAAEKKPAPQTEDGDEVGPPFEPGMNEDTEIMDNGVVQVLKPVDWGEKDLWVVCGFLLILKVFGRESVDKEYSYDGISVLLNSQYLKVLSGKHVNQKSSGYYAYLKDPRTVMVRFPAFDRNIQAHSDQAAVNCEPCLLKAFHGFVGHATANNYQVVEQPIRFPFDLSVQHITDNRYNETDLPYNVLPFQSFLKDNTRVNNKYVLLSFNAIIPDTKMKLKPTDEGQTNDMYDRFANMGFASIPSAGSTSPMDGKKRKIDGDGKPDDMFSSIL